MNSLCCTHQTTSNKTLEFKFKNKQKNIQYSVSDALLHKSVHSQRQAKQFEEVSFYSLLFSQAPNEFKWKWLEEHCYIIKKNSFSLKSNSSKLVVLSINNKNKKR